MAALFRVGHKARLMQPARVSVNVLTHGHCFDGLVSAVLFSRLLRHLEPARHHEFAYRSCGYGPKLKTIPKGWLGADVNAILDFRYVENDRLTYYFDHHKTGFASTREHATAVDRVRASSGKRTLHFDPSCTSCAKLIARVSSDAYDHRDASLAHLVEWADRVDAARFDSPEEAFFARTPALVLADVVERHGDSAFLQRFVPILQQQSVDEVGKSEAIAALAMPLQEAKTRFLAAIRERGTVRDDVACIDLADASLVPAGKFATYVAFPTCRYSVILLRTKDQLKLGVGFNPWSGKQRRHDIATICQREGGGGHAVVGAINFAHERITEARLTMERVVTTLLAD